MRRRSALVLALTTSTILVGCDKCSGKKSEPAATDATTASQPAASDAQAPAPAPEAAPQTSGDGMTQATTTTETAASTVPAGEGAATSTGASTSTEAAASGSLKVTDVKVGSGAEAVDGKKVTVHYTGTLENGTKFDSSRDRGSPFPFVLGSGMVIAGWEQGVKGMKEGGIRKLVIPPNLAYGNRSVGGVIPPNSTLLFEIELLKVE